MIFVQISLKGGGTYTTRTDSDLNVFLDEVREGVANANEFGIDKFCDEWTVKLVEMSEDEFNALDDFAGH